MRQNVRGRFRRSGSAGDRNITDCDLLVFMAGVTYVFDGSLPVVRLARSAARTTRVPELACQDAEPSAAGD